MVDALAKQAVLQAINEMATGLPPSWDSATNWDAAVDGIAEIIADVGRAVSPDHFAILLSAAAMIRRNSRGVGRGKVTS